jgi:acid phosphatase type 7
LLGIPHPNSEVRNDNTYGVIKLTLSPGKYAWEFVPEEGKTFRDSGEGTCHNASSETK